MIDAKITYRAHPGASSKVECAALAAVYKFVLAKKEAAPESRPDAGKEIHERSGKPRIPQ